MVRSGIFFLFIAAALPGWAGGTFAAPGSPDAVFVPLPFESWLTQNEQSRIHWDTRVSEARLTNHQRLSSRVEIDVDGAELAKRRGDGQFLILLQFQDERGGVWQFHESIDLARVPREIKSTDAVYERRFFLLPGDYRVAAAVYDTATKEHSIIKRRLHVSPVHNDPLPEAWAGLPAVELFDQDDPPNNWYQPLSSRLHLAVEPEHPIDIDLVVNLTPAERLSGSNGALSRNLSYLLPIFKVISQVDWRNSKLNVALLDLAHHCVAFEQDDVQRLEWHRAGKSLAGLNPAVIDVHALEQHRFNADFFLSEIAGRIREPRVNRPHVVIVLSSPVAFQAGQELNPVDFGARPDFKVFYLRYQPEPEPVFGGRPIGKRAWAPPRHLPQRQSFVPEPDQLEPLLKPVDPHLYDVTNPEQVRRALAGMMTEISRL